MRDYIALYGHTENENYGSLLTYWSLYKTLDELFPNNVEMIPRSSSVTNDYTSFNFCNPDSHSSLFFKSHCKMAPRLDFKDFGKYNEMFDTFIIGSDMIWKHKQYLWSNDTFYLNFVKDGKKIAYGTSLGTDDVDKIIGKGDLPKVINYLKDFDFISMREFSGVELLKTYYGVDSVQVPDPVFLNDKDFYLSVLPEYEPEDGKKKDLMTYFVSGKFVKIYKKIIPGILIKNRLVGVKSFEDGHGKNITIQNFLFHLNKCKMFATDSFYGVCMCLIFNKPFYWYSKGFDETRFETLKKLFDIEIKEGILNDFDWDKINSRLEEFRKSGRELLKTIISPI